MTRAARWYALALADVLLLLHPVVWIVL